MQFRRCYFIASASNFRVACGGTKLRFKCSEMNPVKSHLSLIENDHILYLG